MEENTERCLKCGEDQGLQKIGRTRFNVRMSMLGEDNRCDHLGDDQITK